MMLSADAVSDVAEEVVASDFYSTAHGQTFEAIMELWGAGRPVDAVSVSHELRRRGHDRAVAELPDLAQAGTVAGSAPRYAEIVRELAVLRQVIAASQEIQEEAYGVPSTPSEFAAVSGARLLDLTREKPGSEAIALGDAATRAVADLEVARGAGILGLNTGLWGLDRDLGGLQDGNLIILAGRPGTGKTALACQIAREVADTQKPVALFSLEMSRAELALRLMCTLAGLSTHRVRRMDYEMTGEDWQKLLWAEDQLKALPLYVLDTDVSTIEAVRARARKLAKQKEIGLIVVDYIQLMTTRRSLPDRQQEVAEVSRSLKQLARDLEIPVLACAQLNRELEHRGDPTPRLSDLRDSGQIEQDADIVLFLHPNLQPSKADEVNCIIAKHRNGPTGTVPLRWTRQSTRFDSIGNAPLP